MKLYITYDPINGIAVPDGKCQELAKSLCITRGDVVIGSELLLHYIRTMVKREVISHEDVIITYQEQKIGMDKDARISNWPNGFCDHFDKALSEILG